MINKIVFEQPAYDRKEILRYARAKDDGTLDDLMDACIKEAQPYLSYRVCYTVLDIERRGGKIIFGGVETDSKTLQKALEGCGALLLFAATVGAPFDKLIMKYSRVAPSRALMFQALGAERVESLCDAFCGKISSDLNKEGKSLRTRVSAGYGDIPLSMQKEIFSLLDCPRKIGLTLNERLLMSPSKSVTAIAGIKNGDLEASGGKDCGIKCALCPDTGCAYRKSQ